MTLQRCTLTLGVDFLLRLSPSRVPFLRIDSTDVSDEVVFYVFR